MALTLIKPQEVVNGGIVRATPFDARFDAQLLVSHIFPAEIEFILTLLGRDMYEAMIAVQNAAISNYNTSMPIVLKFPADAIYETLWTKGGLIELCARSVYYHALPYITLQTGSNGLYTNNTEYAANAGTSNLKYLRETELKNVILLTNSVKDYLCRNKATYPLYDATHCFDNDGEQENHTKAGGTQMFGIY